MAGITVLISSTGDHISAPAIAPFCLSVSLNMVNYRDPLVIQSDSVATSKLWNSVDSIYLWEFVTTLDYEWSIIRGRRPYRWTIWIYSFTRIVTLVAVIWNILDLDLSTPVGCQASIEFQLAFSFLAFMAASLLIVLRIIAIWNKNKFIVMIATSVWITNVAFLIRGITQLRSIWMPDTLTCVTINTDKSKPSMISILVTDIFLILIMLLGLLRLRCHGGGAFSLGRLLWKQGIIWLILAATAEVPPTVFLGLNLNNVFNLMFQIPALIIMSIAATRMYRSLSDFVPGTGISETPQNGLKKSLHVVPKTSRGPPPPIQPNRTEAAVRTELVQYPTIETGYDAYDGACINIEAPLGDKFDGPVLGDIERGGRN